MHSFQSHIHTRQIAPGVSNVKRREVRRPENHSEPPGSVDLLSADCAASVCLSIDDVLNIVSPWFLSSLT